MSKVNELIRELESKGWTVENKSGNLTAQRGDITITGHQHFVEVAWHDFSTMKLANNFLTTMERLDYLLDAIREYAQMADNGSLDQMARWQRIEKGLRDVSWDTALANPEVLAQMEYGFAKLQQREKVAEANQ